MLLENEGKSCQLPEALASALNSIQPIILPATIDKSREGLPAVNSASTSTSNDIRTEYLEQELCQVSRSLSQAWVPLLKTDYIQVLKMYGMRPVVYLLPHHCSSMYLVSFHTIFFTPCVWSIDEKENCVEYKNKKPVFSIP